MLDGRGIGVDGRHPVKAQAVFLVLSRVIGAVFQAALLVLVARQTTPVEFGLVGSILGVITLVVMVGSLGTAQVVLRERAAGNLESVSQALALGAMTSWTLAATGTLAFGLLAVFAPVPFEWALTGYLLLLALVGEKGAEVRTAFMIAERERIAPATNLILRRGVALVAFVALSIGLESLEATVAFGLAYSTGSWIGYVTGWWRTRRRCSAGRIGLAQASAACRAAWPYLSNNISSQARTLDVLLLSVVAGPAQGGFYAAAYRIASPLLVVTTGVATAIVPHSVGVGAKAAATLSRQLVGLHLLLLLVLAPSAWFASEGVVTVLGSDYSGARPLLAPLTAGMLMVGLSTLLGSVLQGQGQPHTVARAGLLFLPPLLLAIVIGALSAEAVGTAVAVAVVYAVKSLYLLRHSRAK